VHDKLCELSHGSNFPHLVSFGEDHAMQTIHIKFLTENDRVRGFFELATRSRIGSLPGQVYQIPLDAMKILDDTHIAYRRASDSEVRTAHDQVRDPSASVL